jgi:Cys-tRNA(Pro)/Cys-tRNA(Cys) deacylase
VSGKSTPGTVAVQRAKVAHTLHEYDHDPRHGSYGLEAAERLGVDPARIHKTLVVALDDGAGSRARLGVAVVPVESKLDLKACATALAAKRADMADVALAEKTTGYVAGGISPLGQKKALPTAIDSGVDAFDTVFVSAGRRGLEIELAPADLVALTNAVVAPIAASVAPIALGTDR